jgi:hypothetical protein
MVNAASFLPGRVQLAPDVWAYEGRAQTSKKMSTGRAVNLMAQGRLQPREWPPIVRTEVRRTLAVDAEGSVVGGFESEWGQEGGSGWIGDSQSSPTRPMSRSGWANQIGRSRPEAEPPAPPAATEDDGLVYCVICEAWMEPDEAVACHNTFDPPSSH